MMKKLLLSALAFSSISAVAQWTPQATGFSATSRGVSEIDIVDANTVWCVAYDGMDTNNTIQEFTKTTDGGENWTAGIIDTGGDVTLAVNNLSPVSGTEAWCSLIDGSVGGGTLLHTTDGGTSWDYANPPGGYISATSFLNVVHFFNSQVGIVQGDPIGNKFEVYRTIDGGATWGQITGSAMPNALTTPSSTPEFGYNGGNMGTGNFFWFVTSRGNIYRTADQGATWSKVTTPITDFGGVNFDNSNGHVVFSDVDGDITHAVGVLVATANAQATTPSYTRYTTIDGGASWSAGTAFTDAYRTMTFIPGSQTLVATGNNGSDYTSAYSTDLGASWIEIDSGTQRTSISFLNGSTGWAGGFNEDDTTGGIFKYTGQALAVPTVGPKASFSVSPNPTNGVVRIANDNSNISDVTVYDLLGKQVFNQKFNAVSNTEINLSSLTSGAYILKATAENGASQSVKIVKE